MAGKLLGYKFLREHLDLSAFLCAPSPCRRLQAPTSAKPFVNAASRRVLWSGHLYISSH